ncbi:hypothetical protein ACFZBM_12335 [Streptomyces lavendulae]|uniref:hypothetical protein n=1 Tax=Streptomyces lavendulae TaxID=1914 RepID=UPI00142DE227|nr:hypothetical protein [Streptomyces lavendulae]
MAMKKWKDQRVYSSTFPALLRRFHHPVSFDTARSPGSLVLAARYPADRRRTAVTATMIQTSVTAAGAPR